MDVARAIRAAGRNLGWLMASRGTTALLSLVYLGLATRSLGVEGFGRFALITSATQAIALFVGFQSWQVVVQYGVPHLERGEIPALRRLVRFCWRLDLLSGVAGTLIGLVVLILFGEALGIDRTLSRLAMLLLAAQMLALRSTAMGVLRLHDRFADAALAEAVTPLVRLAGAALAWWLGLGIVGFVTAWALGEGLTAAAYWILSARTGALGLFDSAPPGHIAAENPGIARFVASTNAAGTLGLAAKQAPVLMIGAYVGPAAAGGFRLAYQLAQALTKVAQLTARAAFPELVRTVKGVAPDRLRRGVWKLSLGMAASGAAILLLVWLIGQPLLALVGGAPYAAAFPLLVWLAAAGCVDLAAVGFEPLLMALHRAGTAFALRAVGTVALIGTMLALLPSQGAHGAAIAILVGSAVTALLLAAGTFRTLPRTTP